MKTINKHLSILLVVMLIMGALGITSFAAVPPGGAVVLSVAPVENSYKPGDTVTFAVGIETIDAVNDVAGGEYEFFFDNTVFEPMTANNGKSFTNDNAIANGVTFTGYRFEGAIDESNSYVAFGTTMGSEVPDNSHGWNAIYHIALIDGTLVHDFYEDPGIAFTFQLKIKDDASNGSYLVGFDYSSAENGYTYVLDSNFGCYEGDVWSYGLEEGDQMYSFNNTPVIIGDTATDPVVTNNGVQVQWDKDDAHVKLGYKATFSDLELTTTYNEEANAYEVNELSEIGVIFSTTIADPTLADVGEGAAKVTSNTIYDNKDGTYTFRAVVRNAPIDNTTTINSVMYITLADGTTSYYSLSGATSPKAAYDAGRLNGMPDFGA